MKCLHSCDRRFLILLGLCDLPEFREEGLIWVLAIVVLTEGRSINVRTSCWSFTIILIFPTRDRWLGNPSRVLPVSRDSMYFTAKSIPSVSMTLRSKHLIMDLQDCIDQLMMFSGKQWRICREFHRNNIVEV